MLALLFSWHLYKYVGLSHVYYCCPGTLVHVTSTWQKVLCITKQNPLALCTTLGLKVYTIHTVLYSDWNRQWVFKGLIGFSRKTFTFYGNIYFIILTWCSTPVLSISFRLIMTYILLYVHKGRFTLMLFQNSKNSK